MTDDPNTATGLAREDAPSLSDIASPDEGQGAWPKGWYKARSIEGFATGKGTQFVTGDVFSKDRNSRNIVICFNVKGDVFVPSSTNPSERKLSTGPSGDRNLFYRMNYRPEAVNAQTVAAIKEAYTRFKKVNAFPSKEMQAVALSLGRIGQLEKALGYKLPFRDGHYDPTVATGHDWDIRLDIDEKGFNTIEAVAASGAHVK